MFHTAFGIGVILAISLASAVVYRRDHRAREYARSDRAKTDSPAGFESVSRWIRLSTVVSGVGALLSESVAWLRLHDAASLVYAGSAVAAAGFVLFLAARRALGNHYSPCFDSYVSTGIVTSGPYRWIRHPIYTANLAILAGFALATGSGWIVLNFAVLLAYYYDAARVEERSLSREHESYRTYLASTGRFVPNPWRS